MADSIDDLFDCFEEGTQVKEEDSSENAQQTIIITEE